MLSVVDGQNEYLRSEGLTLHHLKFLAGPEIFGWSKFKAFADEEIKKVKMRGSALEKVENIEGKGENAGYQHFLLFPHCFQKVPPLMSFKLDIVW